MVRMEAWKVLMTQGVVNFVVIQFDHGDFLAGAIDDGRCFACMAETAARTRSLHRAQGCVKFNFHFLLQKLTKNRPRPGGLTSYQRVSG